MKKINIGISKEIDFKLKDYGTKFKFEKISIKNFNFDAIIITSNTKLDYKIINNCKNLKVIFIMSLHLLSKIKIAKLRKDIKIFYFDKKIKKILNTITATPEFIFGIIILLSKNFLNCRYDLKKNVWNPKKTSLLGSEKMLSLSTLGIVGFGRIGKQLNKIAKTFEMKTLIFKKKKSKNQISLNNIAKKSDFISINLSLNKKTKQIINQNFFKKMKKNSYFINTSKGEIVNYNHLIKYLGKNISGAGIDVYKKETPNDNEIIKLTNHARSNNNLILTPHIAGGTEDSIIKLQKHCIKKIENCFLKI